jgi:hypothetical protein
LQLQIKKVRVQLKYVEATGQMLDNLKMVAADKTDTFQLKYCSCGVKQHPRTLYPQATLTIK